MEAIPGREIDRVIGEAIGVVARHRELPREMRTANQADGYAAMLTDSRQDAVSRLAEMAEAAGAQAVVGLRFDCSEITQSLSEVCAYGTAVTLKPADPGHESASAAAIPAEYPSENLDENRTAGPTEATVSSADTPARPDALEGDALQPVRHPSSTTGQSPASELSPTSENSAAGDGRELLGTDALRRTQGAEAGFGQGEDAPATDPGAPDATAPDAAPNESAQQWPPTHWPPPQN